MNRRLAIIVEGFTEHYFVQQVLGEKLTIETTSINLEGGKISVPLLRKQIKMLLPSYSHVTTMVDYYKFSNVRGQSIESIEQDIMQPFAEDQAHRVIPYLQKHEFEALLFSNRQSICDRMHATNAQQSKLEKIRGLPEEINHAKPPSKILLDVFPDYSKTVDGIEIIKSSDWKTIKRECPRFGRWIDKLTKLPPRR